MNWNENLRLIKKNIFTIPCIFLLLFFVLPEVGISQWYSDPTVIIVSNNVDL